MKFFPAWLLAGYRLCYLTPYDPSSKMHEKLIHLVKQAHDEDEFDERETILRQVRDLGDKILD